MLRETPTNFSLGKVAFFLAEGACNFQTLATLRVQREMYVSHGNFVYFRYWTSSEVRNELNQRSSVVASAERRRRRVRSVLQPITKEHVLSTTNVLFYMWSHETLVNSSRDIHELHRRRDSRVDLFRGQGSTNRWRFTELAGIHIRNTRTWPLDTYPAWIHVSRT